MDQLPKVNPMLDNLLDAAVGSDGKRRRYPWPCEFVKTTDQELVPIGDGTAILMSGIEIAAGVKPVDVLHQEK